jgi:predicted CXXCH cytochrome family protein
MMMTRRQMTTTTIKTLGIVMIMALFASIASAQDDSADAPMNEPTGDNSYCSICHSNNPDRSVTLADGSSWNLYVDADGLANSVHGIHDEGLGLGCIDCHGEDAFPHNQPSPDGVRPYTIEANQNCYDCHETQADNLQDSLHNVAINNGNLAAAVCTDCHGAHDVESVFASDDLRAETCSDCHTSTHMEWQISAHNALSNLGCTSCHNPHAQTLRVGPTSSDLCINCHAEMPNLDAHNIHINEDVAIDCVSCHMHPNDEGFSSHLMEVDIVPCITCHEGLESDAFPPADGGEEDEDTTNSADSDNGEIIVAQSLALLLGIGAGITAMMRRRA